MSQCPPCFLYSPRTQCCPAYAAACLCASPCVSMSPRVTPHYPITPCHRVPSCHHIPPCHSIPQQSPPVPTCPCCPRLSGGGGISAGQRSTQDHPPPPPRPEKHGVYLGSCSSISSPCCLHCAIDCSAKPPPPHPERVKLPNGWPYRACCEPHHFSVFLSSFLLCFPKQH